jgi:hypothetical protein
MLCYPVYPKQMRLFMTRKIGIIWRMRRGKASKSVLLSLAETDGDYDTELSDFGESRKGGYFIGNGNSKVIGLKLSAI